MMERLPKRLIEVDLPIREISAHARREKSIRHGHISTLHIWWARRPLAACRAVICAALWPDPADKLCPQSFRNAAARTLCAFAQKARSERRVMELVQLHWSRWARLDERTWRTDDPMCWEDMRGALLDFIADFANWDASTEPSFLETARRLTQVAHESLGGAPGTRPLVVDPFAGGGAIPLEALRVGADAFASDLNPVAVLLNKVVLEYIPKYGRRLAEEVRRWGEWVRERAEAELRPFYPEYDDGATPIAYLWARTIRCEGPGCGAEVPLVRSLWLSKKRSKPIAMRLLPRSNGSGVDVQIVEEPRPAEANQGTVRRGSATCPCCGYTTPVASVRTQLKARRGGAADARLLCVVTTRPGRRGRFYRLPAQRDLEAVRAVAEALARREREHEGAMGAVPDEPLPTTSSGFIAPPTYGMDEFGLLFTPRQALALTTLVRLVREAGARARAGGTMDAGLAEAVETCLAITLSRLTDLSNSLTAWKYDAECPVHLFGRQAIPIVWDFAEAVLTSQSSGSWDGAVNRTASALEKLTYSTSATGTTQLASATADPLPDDAAHAFVTDPPYYNAVPYADLSDFFYVWLRRILGDLHPRLFSDPLTPKGEEICEMAGWDSVRYPEKDGAWFEAQMRQAMAEGRRVLAPTGVGIVVFAHKSTAGWEAMLQAMVDAGWIITASWPIDTEMGSRLRAMNSAALASSVHLVCRPRENPDGSLRTDAVGDWRDVLRELPKRIHEWMPRLAQEGIVGADAIFACLGPALEVFSRYSRVEKANGEEVTLREYLEHVWAAVSHEALSMIFDEADATGLEEDARLTAMWLWTMSTAGKGTGATDGESSSTGESEDGETPSRNRITGYTLEFDAARKIAQGLGAHLDDLKHLVEVKGDKARLLSVFERTRYLFGKKGPSRVSRPQGRRKARQMSLFTELEAAERDAGRGETGVPAPGATTLDRVHQAMILFAAGRSEALKRFLVEEGAARDAKFWRLAQALSALYPAGSAEKRWVDGVLGRKKGLGFG